MVDTRYALYRHLRQYKRAIEDYDEAIRLTTEDEVNRLASRYYGRGSSYNALGKSREADRDFEKSRELGFGSGN